MFYRKKPSVVEAYQYFNNADIQKMIAEWGEPFTRSFVEGGASHFIMKDCNEKRIVHIGDWILKNDQNEFTVCRSDNFEEEYLPIHSDKVTRASQDAFKADKAIEALEIIAAWHLGDDEIAMLSQETINDTKLARGYLRQLRNV